MPKNRIISNTTKLYNIANKSEIRKRNNKLSKLRNCKNKIFENVK